MTAEMSPAERYAAARRRAAEQATALAPFREMYGFELDPFQLEACRAGDRDPAYPDPGGPDSAQVQG